MRVQKIWYIRNPYEIANWEIPNGELYDAWYVLYKNGQIEKLDTFPINCNIIGENINEGENMFWDFSFDKYCPILIDNKWGFINDQLELVCNPKFDFVGNKRDIKIGGCNVPPCEIHQAFWNNDEIQVVYKNNQYFINRQFNIVNQTNANLSTIQLYNDRIYNISPFSLENLIINCKDNVPLHHRRCPYYHPELNHGADLLKSDEALDCYMMAYGEMHHTKCRAALQNFPFDDWTTYKNSSFGGPIEIVDWGCGQGIGSLAIIEALKDRDLLKWLKKVTLIEPSEASLNRAKSNVIRATNGSLIVDDINKFLPGYPDKSQTLIGLSYSYKNVIHIFSNILDIDGINLGEVAQKLVTSGNNHYILCIGPMNANAFRIDRFYEIFGEPNVFSNIESKNYSYTSDTNYPYTCKTKCFRYDGRNLDINKYNPLEKAKTPIYNEYDINFHISNGVLSVDKAWVYYRLKNIMFQDDLIYIEPELNGIKPDFIIIRPNYGIIVIDVFEQEIKKIDTFSEENNLNDIGDESSSKLQSPISYLATCQDIIIGSLPELTNAVIDENRNLGVVKKVLVCSKASTTEVREFFNKKDFYTNIYGKEFLVDESISTRLYENIGFRYKSNVFSDEIKRKFVKLISPHWHSYREGKFINLTKEQLDLSKSVAPKMQKISGVAGSGKTQVMCTRAINAQVRTGGRILILTYNIALINYLRIRLSEIRADFSWDRICLDHYHRFFRMYARKYDLKVQKDSYGNTRFFNDVKDEIEKYDAIFIDEVQDYATEWLELLKSVFLVQKGEFVVFGDPAQNIYNREIDESGDIRIGVIPGLWNKQLTRSKRFVNESIGKLAKDFSKYYKLSKVEEDLNLKNEAIISHPQAEFSFNYIKYLYLKDENIHIKEIGSQIYIQIQEYIKEMSATREIKDSEIAIISSNISILQELENTYSKSNRPITRTFITKRELDKISRKDSFASYQFKKDQDRIERLLKLTFTTDTKHIKMSTIQSFKGWESSIVFLIILKDKESHSDAIFNSPELVYTGLTRSKENLIVINVGNENYHKFFKENIKE